MTSPVQIILKLLLKWWWLIAVSTALGVGVGYFIRLQQPSVYFAQASVLFDQGLVRGTEIRNLTEINDLMTVTSGLVRREKMLLPVIRELNLNLTVWELNSRLAVWPNPQLPLLEITAMDNDPLVAANIANAVAQEIIDQSPTVRVSQETEFTRQQLRDLQAQIEALQTSYNESVARGATLTSAFEIAQNLQEQENTLATMQQLRQTYADLSATLDDQSGLLTIFESASAETAYTVTGSAMSIIVSGVAGLVLSILTVALIHYFDDRLEWQENLDTLQGQKVLGPLGIIPRAKLPLYIVTMPDAIESEVLRQARAKVALAAGGVPPKSLTVTSYDSGDGKTVTTANLALAAAQAGQHTVLVDADIRKGDAHEVFQLPNVMGLSDILTSREDVEVLLSRALLESGYDRLTILPAGRATADPAALLGSPRLRQVIDILSQQFDQVVVDSVPTIGGPDSAFIAAATDGALIVVNAQRTTRRGFERTLQNLTQGGAVRILGVVFNRVPLAVTSSYNQPYYRRTLAINPDKLNREMMTAGRGKGLSLSFNKNIIQNNNGELLYSMTAAAVQLGVSEASLKNWIKVGYLQTERRGRRRWIRQSELERLLEKLPRHELTQPAKPQLEPAEKNGSGVSTGKLPDMLRGQREALLGYVRDPNAGEAAEDRPNE